MTTPEPVTEDLRIEALMRAVLIGHDYALHVLGRIDAADAAAGIRRVDEWDEKCFGCHQYYNAEGVRCYIDNERASHCLAAASERVGGAS